jgi:hypothetical protein
MCRQSSEKSAEAKIAADLPAILLARRYTKGIVEMPTSADESLSARRLVPKIDVVK